MPLQNLHGKIALVTGASSGIGEAIVRILAEQGVRVVLSARRESRLQGMADDLRRAGTDVLVLPADVRDCDALQSVFRSIRKEWGGVDILINSAGLGRVAPLVSGATDAWREMLEVNVLALAVCTREAIQDMRDRSGHGHIIHIASMSGHRVPEGTGGMYSATKHAVKAMTEALRRELRAVNSPIRISSVSPGFVETEFAKVMTGSAELAQQTYTRYPCLQPSDVARTVLHMLTQPEHVEIHDVLIRPTAQVS